MSRLEVQFFYIFSFFFYFLFFYFDLFLFIYFLNFFQIGSVNSVACVVKPSQEEKRFLVGSFRRSHINQYSPQIPSFVNEENLKDFLLTKMVNGILSAQKAPPFSDMYSKLFKSDFKDLVEQFQRPKMKSKKTFGN